MPHASDLNISKKTNNFERFSKFYVSLTNEGTKQYFIGHYSLVQEQMVVLFCEFQLKNLFLTFRR